MPGSSRLDEHYGADARGRIRPRRSRVWMFWVGVAVLGLAATGYAGRREVKRFVAWVTADWRASTFEGTVVDARTGRGIPAVYVRVEGVGANPFHAREWMHAIVEDSATSADGTFRVQTPRIGRTQLRLRKTGYRDTLLTPEESLHLRIALTPR